MDSDCIHDLDRKFIPDCSKREPTRTRVPTGVQSSPSGALTQPMFVGIDGVRGADREDVIAEQDALGEFDEADVVFERVGVVTLVHYDLLYVHVLASVTHVLESIPLADYDRQDIRCPETTSTIQVFSVFYSSQYRILSMSSGLPQVSDFMFAKAMWAN